MKQFLIYIYFLFSSLFLIEQAQNITETPSPSPIHFTEQHEGEQNKISIDSTSAQSALNSAWNIALLLTGGGQFIPGLPNSILYAILSLIVGLIFRGQEKKRLRALGRLYDRSPNPALEKQSKEGFFKRVFSKLKRPKKSD